MNDLDLRELPTTEEQDDWFGIKKINKQEKVYFKENKNDRMRRTIYLRDMGICQLCNEYVPFKEMSPDHIYPKSKGGTNKINNMQTTHTFCNSIKGDCIEAFDFNYYKNHPKYGFDVKGIDWTH